MRYRDMKTKKIAFIGLLASVSLILAYIEALLPPIYAAAPGIKLGLANIMSVFALYKYGTKEAALVSFVRISLSALLFGNPWSLAYSAAGAFLSLAVMIILKLSGKFSPVGVSIAGGVCHNLGQILLAMLVLRTIGLGLYMAVLAVTGTLAGVLIGLCASLMLKYLKKV